MANPKDIADKLKKEFPGYHFPVFRGFFGKYIAVDIRGKIAFTIWIDKRTGDKELLDEANYWRTNLLKRFSRSCSLHWTKKSKRVFWPKDRAAKLLEELTVKLPERGWIRERLELSLQKMHLIPK